ncbi:MULTISPECIES: hypothetical protein [unclassified Bradyrhizobium]|uniref:hypothetical protein n=1 Tax=unclassified Bradyrhizobium TaxID=2631580 RepID=UPI00102E739F|nr:MULTISPECIES: hypothetical protein [unclassified Bradyrhizobium]MDI4235831.1 hypothetical protein [Bradyrhizobium sp. Arg237L]TAI62812.1 hypothetical protein CWO89_27675 [Bradyrhizobium sp. Leo170]
MVATPESCARTRAFARVMGPWFVIVPGIILLRAPEMGTFAATFFENQLFPWFAGAQLLFLGLLIIALHPYWSSAPAVIISLFGWILALRGVVLMAAPQLIERGAAASVNLLPLVRFGFGALVAIGLYLTYVGWMAKPVASVAINGP